MLSKGKEIENVDIKPDKVPQIGSGVQARDKEKPVYDFQKTRTDSKQMPINFYIKKESDGSRYKELKYKIRVHEKDQLLPQNIKKFFQHVSYVGCFNLSCILIQLDTGLYSLNIAPFIESFAR